MRLSVTGIKFMVTLYEAVKNGSHNGIPNFNQYWSY